MLLLLASLAFAQEVDAPDAEDPVQAELTAAQAELAAARAEVERLQAELQQAQVVSASAQAVLGDAQVALDPAAKQDDRIQAVRRLGASGDPAAIPFVHAATLSPQAPIRAEAYAASLALDPAQATRIASANAERAELPMRYRLEGVEALTQVGTGAAGLELLALTGGEHPRAVRDASHEALVLLYPELLPQAEERQRTSPVGIAVGAVGNGVGGGVLLSAVGTWGQSEAATAIGAVGGSAIGVGTAITYGLTRPVTAGQGVRYTSNVGVGLASAELANVVFFQGSTWSSTENQRALVRVLGTSAGMGVGMWRLGHDPSVTDAIEMDVAAINGGVLGVSIANLAMDPNLEWSDQDRVRAGAALGGAAGAITLQTLLREQWNPSPATYTFAGLMASNAAFTLGLAPVVMDPNRGADGDLALLGASAGYAGALAVAHYAPPTWQQNVLGSWGTVVGGALGFGAPLMGSDPSDQQLAAGAIAGTTLGTAAGVALGNRVEMSPGDLALMGVGMAVVASQSGSYTGYATARDSLDGTQAGGIVLVATGGAALGLTAATQFVDPRPQDMFLMGTAGIWGTWFGVMTPIALAPEGDPENLLLTGAVGADVFLLGAAAAIYGPPQLQARRTVLPQLGGVTGATVGALGASLASQDPRHVALGALIGSSAGLAAGGLWELSRTPKSPGTALLPRPVRRDLPGQIGFSAAPMIDETGATGVMVGVQATGW
jgi:hypothetical protein